MRRILYVVAVLIVSLVAILAGATCARAQTTTGSFGGMVPSAGTAVGAKDTNGRMQPFKVDASGALITVGGSAGNNPSVGTNAAAAPTSSTQVGWRDGSGTLQPVSNTNPLPTRAAKPAAGPLTTAISVTTAATALPTATMTNRASLCVYNAGAVTMYLGPAGVTTVNGLPVPAGGAFCDDVGSQVYYGIVASGTVDARVLEN